MSVNVFEAKLAFGKIGESKITQWLIRARGWSILPVYEIEIPTGKGPQYFTPSGGFVAPDICAFKDGKPRWIEAKHKSVFSWYRKEKRWETGIDLRHYEEYLKVQKISGFPVWLLFLHVNKVPSESDLVHGSPDICPTGLFGNPLTYLSHNISHTSDRHGRTGMVYWARESLQLLATSAEVDACVFESVSPASSAAGSRSTESLKAKHSNTLFPMLPGLEQFDR